MAQGGVEYNVRARFADIQGNLSDERSKNFIVPFDETAPGVPTWIDSEKNGSNIFLSWNNPSDSDLDRILLYTGSQNFTGTAQGTHIHQESRFNSEIIPLLDFGGDRSEDLYFWLRAVDTSNNTGDFSIGNTSINDKGQKVSISRVS